MRATEYIKAHLEERIDYKARAELLKEPRTSELTALAGNSKEDDEKESDSNEQNVNPLDSFKETLYRSFRFTEPQI